AKRQHVFEGQTQSYRRNLQMTWLKGPVTPLVFSLVFTLLSNCSDNQVDIANNTSEDQAAEEIFNSGEKEILRKQYSDAAEKFTEVE
mgnify:CR=1